MVETTIASMWQASDSSLNPSANKAKLLAAINGLKTIGVKLVKPTKSGNALARSICGRYGTRLDDEVEQDTAKPD